VYDSREELPTFDVVSKFWMMGRNIEPVNSFPEQAECKKSPDKPKYRFVWVCLNRPDAQAQMCSK
jgi:hypothetical protein